MDGAGVADVEWDSELAGLLELYGSVPSLVQRLRKCVKKRAEKWTKTEKAVHRMESLSLLLHEEDCRRAREEYALLRVPLVGCGSYPPTLFLPMPQSSLDNSKTFYTRANDKERVKTKGRGVRGRGSEVDESQAEGSDCEPVKSSEEEIASIQDSNVALAEDQLHQAIEESCVGRGRARGCVPVLYIPSLNVIVCRSAALVQKPELFLRKVTGAKVSHTKLQKERDSRDRDEEQEREVKKKITERTKERESGNGNKSLASKQKEYERETKSGKTERKEETVTSLDSDSGLERKREYVSRPPLLEKKKKVSKMERIRRADARALKTMGVTDVIDLMVEDELLRVGNVVQCVTSEKNVTKDTYRGVRVHTMPFPGIELNAIFEENVRNYVTSDVGKKGITVKELCKAYYRAFTTVPFEWEKYCSVSLSSPLLSNDPSSEWRDWKALHSVRLAKLYCRQLMKALGSAAIGMPLGSLFGNVGGILIHCISGWDRTALFASLTRTLLWAEGIMHAWMSPSQFAYHTLAHDWLLFGHDMGERMALGIQVVVFFMELLPDLTSNRYTLAYYLKEGCPPLRHQPRSQEERKSLLEALHSCIAQSYPWHHMTPLPVSKE